MKPIFEYLDYRRYLSDYIEDRRTRGISARAIGRKLGYKSPSYLSLIIEGKRNIGVTMIVHLIELFAFRGTERDYFENLVHFNQADRPSEQSYYWERLLASRKFVKIKQISEDQHEYFSKWYYAAIRELVLLPDFKNDPDWIARTLVPNIPVKAAREAMELLLKLGLVHMANGKFVQTDRNIGTPPEAHASIVRGIHNDMLERAKDALTLHKLGDVEFSALTAAASKEQIAKIKQALREFRAKVHADLCGESITDPEAPPSTTPPNAVYQLNIQLFPLSRVK